MTKIHIVELATLIQTEHKCYVLGRFMTTGMQSVTTAYRDMAETTLGGQPCTHPPDNDGRGTSRPDAGDADLPDLQLSSDRLTGGRLQNTRWRNP